jgi:hypothetical protein
MHLGLADPLLVALVPPIVVEAAQWRLQVQEQMLEVSIDTVYANFRHLYLHLQWAHPRDSDASSFVSTLELGEGDIQSADCLRYQVCKVF